MYRQIDTKYNIKHIKSANNITWAPDLADTMCLGLMQVILQSIMNIYMGKIISSCFILA